MKHLYRCLIAAVYFALAATFPSAGKADSALPFLPVKAAHASPSNAVPVVELRLDNYLDQVVHRNEALQAQMLESESDRKKWKASRGIFEPQLELSATREANRRTNNVEQQASQSGQGLFDERNNIYDGGLDTLLPTGGKVRLGYNLTDQINNVNPYGSVFSTTNIFFTQQYQSFIGVTLNQPLLKNGGFVNTLAPLRIAALDSDIAFQQYRRALMLTLSRAEIAYWNLYFAQEQLRFFDDSVAVTQEILDDNRQKLKAGQGSEMDVLEAESGLALRQTKRNEALQNYFEAVGNVRAMNGTMPTTRGAAMDNTVVRVLDVPPQTNSDLTYMEGLEIAMDLNPDYLIQSQKLKQEEVKLGVAKNQVLPELNLTGAYGYNGLGFSPDSSWDAIATRQTPSWSIGLELIVPLAGNIKGRNQLSAEKLALQEAYTTLRGTESEIGNHLNSAIQKTRAWHESIRSYETVVHFNEELLKTESARLKAGTTDGRHVLQVEADLLDSRQELANALVQYRRSVLDEELTSGAMLKIHGLEITREELKHQTEGLVKQYENYNAQFNFN